jgi:hypothetical protein
MFLVQVVRGDGDDEGYSGVSRRIEVITALG